VLVALPFLSIECDFLAFKVPAADEVAVMFVCEVAILPGYPWLLA
jgi:hypothetical protein